MMLAVKNDSTRLGIDDVVAKTVSVLEKGGIILHATDTVWGLACSAKRTDAIRRMNQIKKRPLDKPCILLLDSFNLVYQYNPFISPSLRREIEEKATPTTVIYPYWGDKIMPYASRDGSVAVRVVREIFCSTLIRKLGAPIASTSANYTGESYPASLLQVAEAIKKSVDWVVPYREKEKTNTSPSLIYKLETDGTLHRVR